MYRFKTALFLAIGITVAACDVDTMWKSGITRGSVSDGVYTNRSLLIQTQIPTLWTQAHDSILDKLSSVDQQKSPDRDRIKPLALYAFYNPANGSAFSLECWPLFLHSDVSTLQEYSDKFTAQQNAALAAKGLNSTLQVERLTINGKEAVKFTADLSTPGQTLFDIQVVHLASIGNTEFIVRNSAWIRDSTEIPMIDSLCRSFHQLSLIEASRS